MPQMITKSRRNVLKIRRFTPVFYRFFYRFLVGFALLFDEFSPLKYKTCRLSQLDIVRVRDGLNVTNPRH